MPYLSAAKWLIPLAVNAVPKLLDILPNSKSNQLHAVQMTSRKMANAAAGVALLASISKLINWNSIWKPLTAWWNQKNIAVLGATASGKDSLIARLKGKEIPDLYINTTSVETLPTYRVDYTFEDGKNICFNVKNSKNVGGEEEHRDDNWPELLKEADIIFYLIDSALFLREIAELPGESLDKVSTLKKSSPYFRRLIEDFQFFDIHLRSESKFAILLNKIDLLPDEKTFRVSEEFLKYLVKNHLKGRNSSTAIRPLSCQNREIFEKTFPIILKDIAGV